MTTLFPFLSALLLATRIYQFTQQGLHFKPPNLLLPLSPAIQPQNQNHKTPNRTPSTHQRYHAFHGSTVARSSPHNTHSQPNSAHTRPLQTSQSTFPHWSIRIRASNTSLATRTRHRDFIARSLSTHWPVFPLNSTPRSPAQSNFLSPCQAPLHSANTWLRAFPVLFSSKDAMDSLSLSFAAAS